MQSASKAVYDTTATTKMAMAMTKILSMFGGEQHPIKLPMRYLSRRKGQRYTISMLLQHFIGLVFLVIIAMSADVYGKSRISVHKITFALCFKIGIKFSE